MTCASFLCLALLVLSLLYVKFRENTENDKKTAYGFVVIAVVTLFVCTNLIVVLFSTIYRVAKKTHQRKIQ